MTYTSRSRDRYRATVAVTTGLTTVAALTAGGWVAGAAAHDHAAEQADQATEEQAAAARQRAAYDASIAQQDAGRQRVVLRPRPEQTRVTLRYVQAAGGVVAPGTGGALTAPRQAPPAASSAASSGAPTTPAPAAPATPAPAAPAPPAPPAPSSGS